MSIWVLIFFCFNLIMAGIHAEMIEHNRPIKHAHWGGGYVISAGFVSILMHSWELIIILFMLRKWSFDLSLNIFRGKPLFYVSAKPASIVDKIHNSIFGRNSVPYMVFYFIATITWTILRT